MKTPDFLLRKSTLEDSGVKRNPPCIRGGIRGENFINLLLYGSRKN
jgi:hypothetical protein